MKPYVRPVAVTACPCCLQRQAERSGDRVYYGGLWTYVCGCERRPRCVCHGRCLAHCPSASATVIDHRRTLGPIPEGWRGADTEAAVITTEVA